MDQTDKSYGRKASKKLFKSFSIREGKQKSKGADLLRTMRGLIASGDVDSEVGSILFRRAASSTGIVHEDDNLDDEDDFGKSVL